MTLGPFDQWAENARIKVRMPDGTWRVLSREEWERLQGQMVGQMVMPQIGRVGFTEHSVDREKASIAELTDQIATALRWLIAYADGGTPECATLQAWLGQIPDLQAGLNAQAERRAQEAD